MRKTILILILGCLLCLPRSAEAKKIYQIGALVPSDIFVPAFEGFKKKMAELGYEEGENVNYDFHNAKGDRKAVKGLAKMLVQDKPDLIVTSSTTATVPVAKATRGANIPVVFLSAGNPLKFIKSYSNSGNNLTGITTSSIDLTEKRMKLLKELTPGIKRVISLHNPKGTNYEASLKAMRDAAKKLRLELVEINATSADEIIKRVKGLLTRKLGDGIIHTPDAIINSAIRRITPDITKEKLPSVAVNIGSVKAGALATYAGDYYSLGQQGAVLVDKILKGAKPMDLPIEQPLKLKLVINLKTAKAIGLKVPRGLLIRADEIIE